MNRSERFRELANKFGMFQLKEDKTLTDGLLAVPKKDQRPGGVPSIRAEGKDEIHQADTLFLPFTKKGDFRYLLVVVDAFSKAVDFEAVRNKQAKTFKRAFQAIYRRPYLSAPKRLQVDAGTEFRGEVKTFFTSRGIGVKVAQTGRHRQVGLVEAMNGKISKALNHHMVNAELLAGRPDRLWADKLPELREFLNWGHKERLAELRKRNAKELPLPKCQGQSCDILPLGTRVRHVLNYPVDASDFNKKLYGKFRRGDVRWTKSVHTIDSYHIRPFQPPLYIISDNDNVAYTRNQLQLVGKQEAAPKLDKAHHHKGEFEIERLVGRYRKSQRGAIYYLIKYKGFPEPESETRAFLWKQAGPRSLVEAFEAQHRSDPIPIIQPAKLEDIFERIVGDFKADGRLWYKVKVKGERAPRDLWKTELSRRRGRIGKAVREYEKGRK